MTLALAFKAKALEVVALALTLALSVVAFVNITGDNTIRVDQCECGSV